MPNTAAEHVAIVMPTKDRAHLLGRAIESVLAQTHSNWTLTIVDDGSTDSTGAVVRAFNDARIAYVRHERPLGPANARNAGIRASAPSAYLAFLDDDDEWLPTKLERQLAQFLSSEVPLAAVGCGRIDYEEDGVIDRCPAHRGDVFEDLLARRARGYGAQLIMVRRRDDFPDILFDPDLLPLEDLDYSMRVALTGPFDFVDEPLVKVHRDDGGPHVWNAAAAVRGYERLAAKYADYLSSRPWIGSYYDVCIARDLARLGQLGAARTRLRRAIAGSSSRLRVFLWYMGSSIGAVGISACARILPIAPPAQTARSTARIVVATAVASLVQQMWTVALPGIVEACGALPVVCLA
jgi:glycosyltransferase involved in cell wall biosynthesis